MLRHGDGGACCEGYKYVEYAEQRTRSIEACTEEARVSEKLEILQNRARQTDSPYSRIEGLDARTTSIINTIAWQRRYPWRFSSLPHRQVVDVATRNELGISQDISPAISIRDTSISSQ